MKHNSGISRSKQDKTFGFQPADKVRLLLKAAEKGSINDIIRLLHNNVETQSTTYIGQTELGIDSCDDGGLTPLHIASTNGHEHVVRFLLTRGASLDVKCRIGWTPLMLAAYYGHLNVVVLLCQNKANVNSSNLMGATPLICACRCGHLNVASVLLENGARTELIGNDFNPYATTPLITAAQHGHLTTVKMLIENGADINFKHPVTGWTALMIASLNGHLDVVRILVESGRADVNMTNDADQTALFVASLHSRRDVKVYLDKRTLRKPESKVSKPSRPSIIEASLEGNYEKAKEILKANEKEVNAQDADGATPLIYASMKGHADIVNLLISKKADLNIQDKVNEWTALMQATCNGHIKCINLLIKAGADINVKDNKSLTVFDLATTVGNPEIIRILARKALGTGNNSLNNDPSNNYSVEENNESEQKGSVMSWLSKMSDKIQPWKTSRNSFPTTRIIPQPPNGLGSSVINDNSDPQALVDTYSLRSSSSILSVLDATKGSKEKPKIALVFPQTKLPDDVVAPILSPFPRRTSFELPKMPKDSKFSNSGGADVSPQSAIPMLRINGISFKDNVSDFEWQDKSDSSSSESSIILKQSGFGRLTNRSQISQPAQFIADLPDSPLSSMTSTNSFFTSVSRQNGRPQMPSVSNGIMRRQIKPFNSEANNTYGQPTRSSRKIKQTSSNTGSVISVNTHHSAPVQPSMVPRPPSKQRNQSTFPAITDQREIMLPSSSYSLNFEGDVLGMLEKLSLEKYSTKFEEEEIDMEAFLTMNDSDLKSLGIKQLTHRKQILHAIRELNAGKGREKDQTQIFSQSGQPRIPAKNARGSIVSAPGNLDYNSHKITSKLKR